MRRRLDRGAGTIEYAALVLVAAVLVGLLATGLPGGIVGGVRSAVCTVFQPENCAPGQRPEPAAQPSGGNRPGTGTEPGGAGQSPPPVEPAGTETPDQLRQQIADAEQDAQAAEAEARRADAEAARADAEAGDAGDILADALKEGSGVADAERCFGDGDLLSCGWTFGSFVPVGGWLARGGKAAKAAHKANKLRQAYERLKNLSKAAKGRASAARERARQARERARGLRERLLQCARGGGNSFAAGTPVLLAGGRHRPIEDVDVGDRTWAADPRTDRAGHRAVIDLITGHGAKRLVQVTIDADGRAGDRTATVTATEGHPFWVASEQNWTDAGELAAGDRLTAADGRPVEVIAAKEYTRVLRVYNLSVADLHTYYVSAGGVDILVHNAPPQPCRLTSAPNSPAIQSKTVYNSGKLRVDVENPTPGQPGTAQIHVQFMGRGADPGKYYFNPTNGTWVTEGGKVLSPKVAREVPQSAINKAYQYLGIEPP